MNLSTLVSDIARHPAPGNPLLKLENIEKCLDIFPSMVSEKEIEFLTVSSWPDGYSKDPAQEGLLTIADFAEILVEQGKKESPKAKAEIFGLFASSDGKRTDASVSAIYGIGLDCDGTGTWDRLRAILDKVGVGYIFYQSASWTPETPKWRCILGLDQPFEIKSPEDRQKWKMIYGYVRALIGTLAGLKGVGFDFKVDNVSRIWYVGTRITNDAPARQVVWAPGTALSLEKLLIASPIASASTIRYGGDGEFRLSLAGLAFEATGDLGDKLDETKFAVRCPRDSEHTNPIGLGKPDSSTVIFSTTEFGGFKCQHGHSNPNPDLPPMGDSFGLKQALDLLELKKPGVLVEARGILENANVPNSPIYKAQEEVKRAKKAFQKAKTTAIELGQLVKNGAIDLQRDAVAKLAQAERLEEVVHEAEKKLNVIVDLLKDSVVVFDRNDDLAIATRIIADWTAEFCVFDQGSFYTYFPELGIWQPRTRQELEHRVTQYQNAWVRTDKGGLAPVGWNFGRIAGVAKAMCAAASKPGFFTEKLPAICFKNGVLRLIEAEEGIEQEFVPHSSEFRHRYSIDVDYNGPVPAPAWEKFLDEVLNPEDQVLLHQFLGACLTEEATRYQRAVVLVGAGANGKTSLLDTVRHMFPVEAQAALAPALWNRRFQATRLIGKAVNCCDEMPNTKIEESDVFKKIITGGITETEYKGQDGFSFKPVAGHLFAANELPRTNDITEGFFRRWIIINMDKQIPNEKRDRYIGEKLMADVPGIISRSISAYIDLRKREDYSVPATADEARAEWQEDNDHVLRFLRVYCEKGTKDDFRSVEDIYRKYKQVATTEGVSINDQVSTRALGRALARFGCKAENRGPAGGRGWLLKFKPMGGIGNVFRSS